MGPLAYLSVYGENGLSSEAFVTPDGIGAGSMKIQLIFEGDGIEILNRVRLSSSGSAQP